MYRVRFGTHPLADIRSWAEVSVTAQTGPFASTAVHSEVRNVQGTQPLVGVLSCALSWQERK